MNQKSKKMHAVRVSGRCNRLIEELSESMEMSPAEVIEKAVATLRRERYFRQMQEDYEAIASDAKALQELETVNAAFDGANADGVH